MKVAIVHEWFSTYAGSERVVEQLLEIWPDADVFAVVDFLPESDRGFLKGKRVNTTFVQKLPLARTKFRNYLPLMPLAIEQLDMRSYDLVLSSNHAVAKGVITGPDQLHISYVHSPIRYAWDLQHQYLKESGLSGGIKSWVARAILHYMRIADQRSANGVDQFVANSEFIGRRIRKAYGRESQVIYPPVDTTAFTLREEKSDFYLTASRMVPYKCMPLIVEAFSKMPEKRLIVIGDGTELAQVRSLASKNVEVMGYQPFSVLKDRMQQAKAFVFAAEEDFGITPVEAQACGTPVIAYGRGGALETVLSGAGGNARTGVFFANQTVADIISAVSRFEQGEPISPKDCRANAERFSPERFRDEMRALVTRLMQQQTAVTFT